MTILTNPNFGDDSTGNSNLITWNVPVAQFIEELRKAGMDITKEIPKAMKKVNQETIKIAKGKFRAMFDVSNHNINFTGKYLNLKNSAKEAGNKELLKKLNQKGKANSSRPILQNFVVGTSKKNKMISYIRNNSFYASMLENGADIKPNARLQADEGKKEWHNHFLTKKQENAYQEEFASTHYLTIYVKGQWKKVKEVRIIGRHFMKSAMNDVWGSNIAKDIMAKQIDKAVSDFNKKYNDNSRR